MLRRRLVGWTACAGGAAALVVGCGGGNGATSPGTGSDGGGVDATTAAADGAAGASDGSIAEAGPDAGGGTGDAGACAPPSSTTTAAVCVTVSPEAIAFLNEPGWDGKGLLDVEIFSRAYPDTDAGLAAPVILPPQDAGAGDAGFTLLDLSQPVPVVRFEVAATTAYIRAIFVDNVASLVDGGTLGAGWWLGGYDLSKGFDNAPLLPVSLTLGQGTSVTLDLVALRQLTLSITSSVQAPGNGQGPTTALALNTQFPNDSGTYFYGVAQSSCANVSGDASATVPGWVVGAGPYWVLASLDEFGVGTTFPPGGMFSLLYDAGVLYVPPIDLLTYDASAYWVNGSAVLTFANPWDGGADAAVTCH